MYIKLCIYLYIYTYTTLYAYMHTALFFFHIYRIQAREQGSILYCTTGILLNIMKIDPALKNFSHVILDEIHERSTESDFILSLLKLIIPKVSSINFIYIYIYIFFFH